MPKTFIAGITLLCVAVAIIMALSIALTVICCKRQGRAENTVRPAAQQQQQQQQEEENARYNFFVICNRYILSFRNKKS